MEKIVIEEPKDWQEGIIISKEDLEDGNNWIGLLNSERRVKAIILEYPEVLWHRPLPKAIG